MLFLLNDSQDIQLISEAEHYIYIENQFLSAYIYSIEEVILTLCSISNTGDYGPVQNLIAKALVERILRAAREGKRFKVVVLLPEVPGRLASFYLQNWV